MKKTVNEFKEFIAKGNVVSMAVGVVMGGAFGSIVTALTDKILMPIVGIFLGGGISAPWLSRSGTQESAMVLLSRP